MINNWRHIRRKQLLKHSRITIVEDTVELPSGERVSYIREAPVSSHSVAVIALNTQGEILVQREYSYPPNQAMYQLPGGIMYPSEDIIAAANRELSEESGYIGRSCTIIGSFYVNNRRSDRKQFVVLCKDLMHHKRKGDKEEYIESSWMSLHNLRELIRSGDVCNIGLLAALQLLECSQPTEM